MSEEITAVVFRKWKNTADIIALFPASPADINGWFCDAYEHVGQHGGADYYGVVNRTVPASEKESEDLAVELRRIGYRLRVLHRASPCHHERRRQIALKWWSA